MKILLTGGTGFIGRHLVPKLINAGHDVFLLIRNINNTFPLEGMLRPDVEAIVFSVYNVYY